MERRKAWRLMRREADKGFSQYGWLNSAHEGYAVIKEEFDELWEEIKKKDRDDEKMMTEAVHTGAMILRFLIELC